jgi:hypothetical protein
VQGGWSAESKTYQKDRRAFEHQPTPQFACAGINNPLKNVFEAADCRAKTGEKAQFIRNK